MELRPGFGIKHPEVATFLNGQAPASSQPWKWPNGDQFILSSYFGAEIPPDELITSVRCIVTIGTQLLVHQRGWLQTSVARRSPRGGRIVRGDCRP